MTVATRRWETVGESASALERGLDLSQYAKVYRANYMYRFNRHTIVVLRAE